MINGEERVLILVDGMRQNNDQGSMTRASATLSMLPSVKNIERIEVVKGAGSALYGSDAVGGVINIITKDAKKNETTLDMYAGSWGSCGFEAMNQGHDGAWKWIVTGGAKSADDFDYKASNGEGYTKPFSAFSNNSLSIKADNKLNAGSTLEFYFAHRTVNSEVEGQDWMTGEAVNNQQYQLFNNASVTYKFKEDKKLSGFVRYFNNYKASDFQGEYTTRMQGIDVQDGWQLGKKSKLVAGFEHHWSTSDNAAKNYVDEGIRNTAIYLQDTLKMDEKWILVAGLRMDSHSDFGTHWSPKLALNYRADKATKVYASWGRVFKAPTADDLFYNDPYMMGNPNLDAETGHAETIGITHDFNKDTTLDVNFFHTVMNDAIKWAPVDPADTWGAWTPKNLNQEKKYGVNISFTQKLSPSWSYSLGYSHISSEAKDENGETWDNYYSQPNGYRIAVNYQQGRWKANLLGNFASGLDSSKYGYDKYATFDFNTSYKFDDHITAYFKALNLTNQAYPTYSGMTFPGKGRCFQLGVNITF